MSQGLNNEHESIKGDLKKLWGDITVASDCEGFKTQIQNAINGDHLSVDQWAGHAEDAYDRRHKDERRNLWRKTGRRTLEVVSALGDFNRDYCEVFRAASEFGGPFGKLGYESVSMLLNVFIRKTTNDTKFIELVREFRCNFGASKAYEDIYPRNERIKSLINNTSRELIQFFHQVIRYYTKHRGTALSYLINFYRNSQAKPILVRCWMAIFDQRTTHLIDLASTVDKSMFKITEEARICLHTRVQELQQRLIEGQTEDRKYKEREQADRDKENLEDLKSLLMIPRSDQNMDYNVQIYQHGPSLSTLKKNLQEVFPNRMAYPPGRGYTLYRQMSFSLLQERKEYVRWIGLDQSCLLLLSGKTDLGGRYLQGCSHSWLSPAVVLVAEHLQKAKKEVALFSCMPGMLPTSPCIPDTWMVASIIIQIVQKHPHLLRGKMKELETLLRQADMNVDFLFKALIQLLPEMKNFESKNPVFILVDRVDKCSQDFAAMVKNWTNVVRESIEQAVCLKIMIVEGGTLDINWGSSFWEVDEAPPGSVQSILHWNQPEISFND